MKFLTITDLSTIEFVNDLNYIVSAGISARGRLFNFPSRKKGGSHAGAPSPVETRPHGVGPRGALRDSGQSGWERD